MIKKVYRYKLGSGKHIDTKVYFLGILIYIYKIEGKSTYN